MACRALVLDLTVVCRNTDRPFVERCRAIEPKIDTYLRDGTSHDEQARLKKGRRLLDAAGLNGALGPYFGAHVVRRAAQELTGSSPRFLAARQLLEHIAQWPCTPHQAAFWQMPTNRARDEWALQLAASCEGDRLMFLAQRWVGLRAALRCQVQTNHASALNPIEQARLWAIKNHWSTHFGEVAALAAAHLLPPSELCLPKHAYCAQARRVVHIWSDVDVLAGERQDAIPTGYAAGLWPKANLATGL